MKPCGPGTRCWCQVGGGFASPTGPDKTIQSVDDGDKTNSSPGRARSKPFKPLRREGRTVSAEPVVTPPVHFFRTGDRGCGERPVFPAPSVFRGAPDGITPGAMCAAGMYSCICCLKIESGEICGVVIPGRCAASNYDVRLHIGESRDSGSGAAHHPGMTKPVAAAPLAKTWIASSRSLSSGPPKSGPVGPHNDGVARGQSEMMRRSLLDDVPNGRLPFYPRRPTLYENGPSNP